jgi:hypothetical protein
MPRREYSPTRGIDVPGIRHDERSKDISSRKRIYPAMRLDKNGHNATFVLTSAVVVGSEDWTTVPHQMYYATMMIVVGVVTLK